MNGLSVVCFIALLTGTSGYGATPSASPEDVLRLTGPEGGLVLWEQAHTRYVDSPDGLEVQARLTDKNAPLYLSLDVKDPSFQDGASPVVEFRFEYFDLYPVENLRFDDVPTDDWKEKPKAAIYNKYEGYGATFEQNDRRLRAKWLQAYLACISLADAQFGRVMDALAQSGHADDTIVLVMGDHGYHIGEHFLYGKVTLFEESARVHFVMRVPGRTRPGTTTQSFAELIDVYPTLIDLCALDAPSHLQGKSLVPLLTHPDAAVRDSVYTVVTRPGMLGKSVRYQHWRYAEWGSPNQAELYDLTKDPDEFHNLVRNPEYEQVVTLLRERLENSGGQ